jgi:hypothetical protein
MRLLRAIPKLGVRAEQLIFLCPSCKGVDTRENDVVILQDVADVAKARTWYASSEMKTMMEKSGVLGSPSIRFAAAA